MICSFIEKMVPIHLKIGHSLFDIGYLKAFCSFLLPLHTNMDKNQLLVA